MTNKTENTSLSNRLPSFGKPPVNEVVCGMRFRPPDRLRIPHIGLLWDKFRADYPILQHAPPISSTKGEIMVDKITGLPLPRVWFINPSEDQLIQFQYDRFYFNWRKKEREYPRYEQVISNFETVLNAVKDLFEDCELGELEPMEYELSYINHIPKEMPEAAVWQPEIEAYMLSEQDLNGKRFWEIIFDNAPTVDQLRPKLSIYWGDNPFTQTELLSTQDDQVQALIHQIRKSKIISNHESLANNLLALFNIAKEENPTCPGIAVDSLSNFYDFFFQLHTNLKTPTLSLSPDYNIYTSWRSNEQLFSAHFLPTGEIRFVLFKPNKRHPNHKIRITGTATSDTLGEIIPLEILNDWVFDERG